MKDGCARSKQEEYLVNALGPENEHEDRDKLFKNEVEDWMQELFNEDGEIIAVVKYKKEWVIVKKGGWNVGRGQEAMIYNYNIDKKMMFGKGEKIKKNEISEIIWNKNNGVSVESEN